MPIARDYWNNRVSGIAHPFLPLSLVYVYDFNGVNNAVETYRPIVPNATTDAFTQSITLYGPVPTDGVLFAKNLSATDANKELEVSLASSEIKVIVGGATTLTSVNITTEGVYIFSFDSDLVITRNGVEIYNAALTRGTVTEPTATMTYAAGHNGTLTTYTDYYDGVMRNCLTNVTESATPSNRYVRSGNGVNAYGQYPALTLAGEFELEFDFNEDNITGTMSFLGGLSDSSANYIAIISGNSIRSRLDNSGTTSAYTITGGWKTLTLKRDAANLLELRVDGALYGTLTTTTTGTFELLWANNTPTNFMNAEISNLKFWTGGNRTTGTLVRDYPIDEPLYDDALVDYSGNNQNGTYFQFDQSDVSFAPLLDANFKMDDNSADLVDSLGGANAEIKNHDPANWSQINA